MTKLGLWPKNGSTPMLYTAYEARRALSAPLLTVAGLQSAALNRLPRPIAESRSVRSMRAVCDTMRALEITHRRPAFGIDAVEIGSEKVRVGEEVVTSTPFGTLLHFTKEGDRARPRVLVVPGLAGHYGTLVRGTVRTLLPDHDVFVADWHNARDIPPRHGRFGLDEYIRHLIDFLAAIGPGAHLMAVCQPCVPALAAAAIMAEDAHPAEPSSVILMAGPVDARINPGSVNGFATRAPRRVLERAIMQTVPLPHRGAGRRVYPGFLQVMGFMWMDPRRHASAFTGLFRDTANGNDAQAARTKTFYEEYFAVLDITAEFYFDTLQAIFTEHHLARGCLKWNDRVVDPSAISTALLTVEAENDELCPPGQTRAAHGLCSGIPTERRQHHLQPGVGHYGVFNGSRFDQEIYPVIRRFIAESD
jgi:polyhydroxyalkanoate depolymerase